MCLAASLLISSLQAFLSTQIHTVTVPNPSPDLFDQLSQAHSATLHCSCSQISIPYSHFISIVPQFHQICSSQFVSPEWYSRLVPVDSAAIDGNPRFENALGSSYFQILSTLCAMANRTVTNAYRLFSENAFINDRAIPNTIFSAQIATALETFNRSTTAAFTRIYSLARSTSQANQLGTRTFSNFGFAYTMDGQISFKNKITSYVYPGYNPNFIDYCFCISDASRCGYRAYVHNTSLGNDVTYLTDLIVRCLPTESALNSTLECWYDHSCYSAVLTAYIAIGAPDIPDVGVLKDVSSRFAKNATMELMMTELLIENWSVNVSYNQFYSECAPASCIYTVEQRFDWFFVILTIVGVYGGLSKGLQLVLPLLVQSTMLVLKKLRSRIRSFRRLASPAEGVRRDGE